MDLDFKYKTQDNYGEIINIDDGGLKVKFGFENNTLLQLNHLYLD